MSRRRRLLDWWLGLSRAAQVTWVWGVLVLAFLVTGHPFMAWLLAVVGWLAVVRHEWEPEPVEPTGFTYTVVIPVPLAERLGMEPGPVEVEVRRGV